MGLRVRFLSVFLFCGCLAWGQVTTATFYGILNDSTGAVIPGAAVSLVHEQTGAVVHKVSHGQGEFVFDFLRVGKYTLQIEASGFKKYEATGMELNAAQSVRRTFTLELGAVTETVSVAGTAPLLNTVAAEQRESIPTRELTELPVARRNFSNILSLGTGITKGDIGGVRMNGLGRSGVKITVDGTDATSNSENPGTSMYQAFNYIDTVSIESIQEVQTTKGVVPAEYALQLSGNVNIITRSGTNNWHGSLFENFQAENLNARNQFLTIKPPLTFNQFGGSIGGPIRRDRIFIFGTYEGYRETTSQVVSGDVPTERMRQEMIAAVPVYKIFLDSLPLPNQPHDPTGIGGRFIGAGASSAHDNHGVVKGDIRVSSSSLVALTYVRSRPYRITPRVSHINSRDWQGVQERGTASYTTFGSNWSSETRFGYNSNDVNREDRYWSASLDPSQPEGALGGRRLPSIAVPGFDNGGGAEIANYFGPTWSIEEKFARHVGKHSFKFGGLFQRRAPGRFNIENPRLNYDNKADLLANIPSRSQFFFGVPYFTSKSREIGLFIQDDWRVRPNLVINLGMRYDFFSKLVAKAINSGQTAGLFNLDGLRDDRFNFGPPRPADDPFENDAWANIGPRVGFSYNVGGAGKTVIRGGLSVMFAAQPWDSYVNSVGESPVTPIRAVFSKAESAQRNIRFPIFNDTVRTALVALNRVQITEVFEPTAQNPYSINLYVGVQRELSPTLMLETAFVGNRGVKFRVGRVSNLPDRVTGVRRNPTIGEGRYFHNIQNSVYYSWQTSLRKRYSRNLSGAVHYTWGRALSYAGGDTGADFSGDSTQPIQDFFNIRANRGPSSGDLTHNLIAEYVYDLPGFASLGAVRHAIGGWQISGVFSASNGPPFTITQPTSYAASRPDYIGGQPIFSNSRETLQYLNRAAFATLPIIAASGAPPRPGNIGQNALRLPSRWEWNFSVGKNFNLTERYRLQLRGDMFNFLNHTNFSGLTSNITSGNFGRFSATTGPRIVQVNARLSW